MGSYLDSLVDIFQEVYWEASKGQALSEVKKQRKIENVDADDSELSSLKNKAWNYLEKKLRENGFIYLSSPGKDIGPEEQKNNPKKISNYHEAFEKPLDIASWILRDTLRQMSGYDKPKKLEYYRKRIEKFFMRDQNPVVTLPLKTEIDHLAPDGSEIRLLPENKHGGMAHCTLPPEKTSKAVKHKTVEEIWYILEGKGKMWRKKGSNETVIDLKPNLSLTIPTGTNFQFKNTGSTPLKIIIATMPPWPGAEEAEPVEGCW
jgi:mannose-6-phosphate isomerase-like protein (cupin superfamily)